MDLLADDAGEEPSPLGDARGQAAAEGYPEGSGSDPLPRVLLPDAAAQGPNAPGGRLDYVVDGKMTLGYAVVAYPAEYGNSGIMTFIMGPDGVVYQKDLGAKTRELASGWRHIDPDASWTKVE